MPRETSQDLLLQGLPARLWWAVLSFLREYLGTSETEVPFGGREESLTALESWLASEDHPYALLVAEAGRGKSALLARWAVEVAEQGRAQVILAPISIRFGTSQRGDLLSLLGARLRTLLPTEGSPPRFPESWRLEILEQLSGAREEGAPPLLLILDGLDEATDWKPSPGALLPEKLGRGVKVLVSARPLADCGEEGWRRALGWGEEQTLSIPLPRLDRDGIADIFRQKIGLPDNLTRRVLLTRELLRLSEGEPLLVRLYLEALHARGGWLALRDGELSLIQPGLRGYFARWWEEQRKRWADTAPQQEEVTRALLGLFSCALGPLSRRDLEALFPGEDATLLTPALEALGRLLVGNGEKGYIFSHPRLGYYFSLNLPPKYLSSWEERLLVYGEQTLLALQREDILPEAASAYLVRWYGTHLARAEAPSASLEALVSPVWQKAWSALTDTSDGFLADVERAFHGAMGEGVNAMLGGRSIPADAIARMCRSALVEASLHSMANRLPAPLILALVEAGVWSPAVALSHVLAMTGMFRERALVALTPFLSAPLVRRALDYTKEEGDFIGRNQLLLDQFPGDRSPLLALVRRLVALGHTEEALALGKRLPRATAVQVFWAVLPLLPVGVRGEVFEEALTLTRAIKNPELRNGMLFRLAVLSGDTQPTLRAEAVEAFLAGERSTPKDGEENLARPGLTWLALLAEAGETSHALQAAQTLQNTFERIMALSWIALYAKGPLRKQAAEEGLLLLEEPLQKGKGDELPIYFYGAFCRFWVSWPEGAEALCRKYLQPTERACLLARLAREYDPRYLPEALTAVQALERPHRLLGRLLLSQFLEEPERHQLARELLSLAEELLSEEMEAFSLWREVKEGLLPMSEIFTRERIAIEAARLLPHEERVQRLLQALDEARAIHDHGPRSLALMSLATFLPKDERLELLASSLQEARLVRGDGGFELASLAELLEGEERASVAREALAAATWEKKGIGRSQTGAGRLIPLLPEEERPQAAQAIFSLLKGSSLLFLFLNEESFHWVLSYLTPPQFDELWQSILSGSPGDSRTGELSSLLQSAPPAVREARVPDLLESALVAGPYHDCEELRALLHQLPRPPLEAAWKALPASAPDALRAVVGGALACQLAEAGEASAALDIAQTLSSGLDRALALLSTLPPLAEEERRGVFAECAAGLPEEPQVFFFTCAARILPQLGWESALLSFARKRGHPRELICAARGLPEGQRQEVLQEAVTLATERDQYSPLGALHLVWGHAHELDPDFLYPWFCSALRSLAGRSREELLHDSSRFSTSFLAPFIARLGGKEALQKSAQAILEITTWMP